ncbi:hypothetical protein FRC08_006908 [Ceratobasidium sp. 394]|nr:hypothetical protein FRC08_006908 [Ceratobasidium sp. 394]
MTAEAMQWMIATLQTGLKDFHNRTLLENQKVLQSSQQKEQLLDTQAKQLESIQELAKQVIKHAQTTVVGSKEALVRAKEAEERAPNLNRTIKEINDGWWERDDKLTRFARETTSEQQKRDEELNDSMRVINSTLLSQHNKLRDIEELLEAIEGQVPNSTPVAEPEVWWRSSTAAPENVPEEGEDQDPLTLHSRPASPFEKRSFLRHQENQDMLQ